MLSCCHGYILKRIDLVVRTLGLRRPSVSSMVGILLILAFTSHVSYLTFVSFDYGYNMAANASFGKAFLLAPHHRNHMTSGYIYRVFYIYKNIRH